ncbi:MAG: DNA internalization-related competence protein ComEC/Rec2 [Candidatus Magnetomorum sp.]|nr:DNA internalization-related competence protein ComEC/Rec2 [Candidatus Magnetomorum sp.]
MINKLLELNTKYPSGICFFFMIIIAVVVNQKSGDFPPDHISHYIDTHVWQISGSIIHHPEYQFNKTRLRVNVYHVADQESGHDIYGTLKVSIWGNYSHLKKGMHIRFRSTINDFKNFKNPGGFDYKHYMNFQEKIDAHAYAQKNSIEILNPDAPILINPIENITEKIFQTVSQLITDSSSKKASGFLHAILLGDRNYLQDTISTVFIATGTVHLLAISGLHMGMIAMTAFLCFRWLFRRSEMICLYGWSDICATLPAFILMVVYFFISGMSPSSQRAFIMISVFLASHIFSREGHPLNTLCFAGGIILLWDTRSLYSISFQMSFCAVLIILLGSSKFSNLKGSINQYALIRYLWNMLLCSILGIIATSPLALHYFYHTSFMGIFTNFLAVPIVGFCILPLSMISILTLFFWPSLALKIMMISGFASDLLIDGLIGVSHYSGPFEIYCHLNFFELFCWYSLVFLCFVGYQSYFKYAWAVIVLIIFVDALYWTHHRFFQDTVRVTLLDVGIGNAAVVELPGGKCIMIDGGGLAGSFDIGKHVVAPYLWQNKIKTVDTLILTHPDRDHLQGLIFVAQHFNVQSIWSNGDRKNSSLYKKWLDIIETKKIHPIQMHANSEQVMNNVRFRFFNPPASERSSKSFFKETNNNSLVIQMQYQGNTFLFPGDIEQEAEAVIVQSFCDTLKSDLLLCPHHGSRTSSTQALINCVQPDLVFISSGKHYKHHLPHPSVIHRYVNTGCQIHRTDQDGAMIIILSEKGYQLKKFISPSMEIQKEQ